MIAFRNFHNDYEYLYYLRSLELKEEILLIEDFSLEEDSIPSVVDGFKLISGFVDRMLNILQGVVMFRIGDKFEDGIEEVGSVERIFVDQDGMEVWTEEEVFRNGRKIRVINQYLFQKKGIKGLAKLLGFKDLTLKTKREKREKIENIEIEGKERNKIIPIEVYSEIYLELSDNFRIDFVRKQGKKYDVEVMVDGH